MWVIGLPLLLAVLYYALFAQDRYVSTAQVVVRQTQGGEAPALPGLAVMLGGINPTSREETMFLREFITSMDMLNVLQDKLKWSEHYAGRWQDPLYWLSPDAPREDQLEYYRRVVQAYFDEQTGLLLVEVQAFAPEFAQQVLQVVLAESERFVNEISHRMAREQMQFAEAELAKARKHYEEQRAVMLQFQGANNLLDPEAAAMARATTLADLEGLLIKERATLKALLATLSPNTPQVRQQRTRIEALEQQLQAESRRLVSTPAGDKLNVIAAQYRSLMVDAGIRVKRQIDQGKLPVTDEEQINVPLEGRGETGWSQSGADGEQEQLIRDLEQLTALNAQYIRTIKMLYDENESLRARLDDRGPSAEGTVRGVVPQVKGARNERAAVAVKRGAKLPSGKRAEKPMAFPSRAYGPGRPLTRKEKLLRKLRNDPYRYFADSKHFFLRPIRFFFRQKV